MGSERLRDGEILVHEEILAHGKIRDMGRDLRHGEILLHGKVGGGLAFPPTFLKFWCNCCPRLAVMEEGNRQR